MEQRKVIKFGKSAFCMTLPHTWVKKHRIKKGDSLNVQETLRNSLEIFPKTVNTNTSSSLSIDITKKSTDEIIQLILATYLNGYTTLTLKGSNTGKVGYLREHIHEFIAAEIMEVTTERIVIHVFWDIETINLEKILRRIDHIIRSIFEETKDLLDAKSRISDIKEKGDEIRRQVLLAKRAITYALNNSSTALQFNLSSLDLYYISYISYFSGKIGEYLPIISEKIESNMSAEKIDETGKEEFSALLTQAYKYYEEIMDVYNKKNKGQQFVISEYQEFYNKIQEFQSQNTPMWKNLIGEYLMLLVRTIKEMEFVMINLENAPKPNTKQENKLYA